MHGGKVSDTMYTVKAALFHCFTEKAARHGGGMRMKLLVVIPAYNEQGNILHTLRDLEENCPEADVIVVNDCSKDDTPAILREADVPHLNLPVNLGIGGAVQSGYLYGMQHGYDIAVQFDGDGQHRADCIRDLIQPLLDGEADMTVGSRFAEGSDKDGFKSSAVRRVGIRVLSFLIKAVTGQRIRDATSGFRAVNRRLMAYYAENYAQDFPEPEAIVLAINNGFRVKEVPARMNERGSGESSIAKLMTVYYMIKVSLAILVAGVHTPKGNRKKANA